LYFVIIWSVILNNLSSAFQAIEQDIDRFLDRIRNESSLEEVAYDLHAQKDNVIPNQRGKILLVRAISILILVITICAYLWIYQEYIMHNFIELMVNKFTPSLGFLI